MSLPATLRKPLQVAALTSLIAATVYVGLWDYARYGLEAAHIDEMDPFRLAHGAELSIPNEDVYLGTTKDRIPALTNPAFVPAGRAPQWLRDEDRVIGIVHGGVAKAYPTLILLWHEAVNDEVAGKPYLVTY